MPRRLDELRRNAGRIAEEFGEEPLDGLAAGWIIQIGREQGLAAAGDLEIAAVGIEPGVQLGQALVAHEHEEIGLVQMDRMRRVEGRIAARERETAIMRQAAAGFESHGGKRLGTESLDGIAVEAFDDEAHGFSGFEKSAVDTERPAARYGANSTVSPY